MSDFALNEQEKQILLQTARNAIAVRLGRKGGTVPAPTENLQTKCGAFVTLHKGGTLRGCIGQMTGSMPLIDMIGEMALSSAFHDPRFPSVGKDELDHLVQNVRQSGDKHS